MPRFGPHRPSQEALALELPCSELHPVAANASACQASKGLRAASRAVSGSPRLTVGGGV